MLGKLFLPVLLVVFAIPYAFDASAQPSPTGKLTVAQILDKNAAARGGLQTWQKVQTLSLTGKMDAGGKPNVQLPFVWDFKRPRKSRLELTVGKQTAIQVYDGTNGWKLRPFLNRHEVETFNPEEMKVAAAQSELDGPLMEAAAKSYKVELAGTPSVEGHPTYELKVTQANGESRHVWVDARTFLEVKMEGSPRRLDGKYHPVNVFFRDFQPVDGLQLPFVIETVVDGVKQTEKTHVEKVVVNPQLDDSLFTKPK